jgi:hypothetical protein
VDWTGFANKIDRFAPNAPATREVIAMAWPVGGAKHRHAETLLGCMAFTERGAKQMSLDARHYALCSCVSVAMLAGCGGPQPQIGAPGAMSQSSAIATLANHGESRTLPEANGEDLIYATGPCGGTCVISYPAGKVVGSLSVGGYNGSAACTDSKGNVFITNSGTVVEYAHGGTTPIETLNLPGGNAYGCSVDPKTGNLAVMFQGAGGDVAIFPDAKGKPVGYASGLESSNCGYDNEGNLFVDGFSGHAFGLSQLLAEASKFSKLSVSQDVGEPGKIQWDGDYMTWESTNGSPYGVAVSRLSISGSEATVVGVTRFKGLRTAFPSWIYGKQIIIPYSHHTEIVNNIGSWPYPQGGKAVDKFQRVAGTGRIQSVTLSPGGEARTNEKERGNSTISIRQVLASGGDR